MEEMLGYKIPVVWPEDDWFVIDRCGSVAIAASGRKGKTARGRDRVKKRQTRLNQKEKPWKRSHPGAFFGFPPGPTRQSQSTPQKTAVPAPAKKRRRRRPK
jgi:ATP-dependent RNA helicase RhlB